MSKNDIKIKDVAGHNVIPTRVYQVTSGVLTSIKAGEPVIMTTIGTNQFAALAVDADPTIGTDYLLGIAAGDSTDTVAAAGTIEVYLPLPGVVYRAKAKSAAAADTAAEIAALANKRTIFDLTTGVFTIDTGAADGATNGLILTGTGDATTSEVDFMISTRTTVLAF